MSHSKDPERSQHWAIILQIHFIFSMVEIIIGLPKTSESTSFSVHKNGHYGSQVYDVKLHTSNDLLYMTS